MKLSSEGEEGGEGGGLVDSVRNERKNNKVLRPVAFARIHHPGAQTSGGDGNIFFTPTVCL